VFGFLASLLQALLVFFKFKERDELKQAGADAAEAETAKRVERMVRDGQEAAKKADKTPDFTTNDPNNRLRR
jgi:hypothetical protein